MSCQLIDPSEDEDELSYGLQRAFVSGLDATERGSCYFFRVQLKYNLSVFLSINRALCTCLPF